MNAKYFVKVFKKKGEDKYFIFVHSNQNYIFAGEVTGEELPYVEEHIDLVHAFPEVKEIEEKKRNKSHLSRIFQKRSALLFDADYSNNLYLKREYEFY